MNIAESLHKRFRRYVYMFTMLICLLTRCYVQRSLFSPYGLPTTNWQPIFFFIFVLHAVDNSRGI